MSANDLARELARDAEGVCRHVHPDGSIQGQEWVVGTADGGAGESLRVCLTGNKAGTWKDCATGDAGDLVDLWMQVRNLGLRQACDEIHKYLGIKTEPLPPPRRAFSKPSREGLTPTTEITAQWLTDVRRLTAETCGQFKIAMKDGALMFPYERDGELIAATYRSVHDKKAWAEPDCEPCLFGWQIVEPTAREITLVAGEFNAMSMFEYGRAAVGIPLSKSGAKQSWIEFEFERLAVYDTIYLCLEQGAENAKVVQEVVRRLGRERCKVVQLPCKDANACWADGVPVEKIDKAFVRAKTVDPERLRSVSEFEDAVVREFEVTSEGDIGIRLPWESVGDRLILRPSEVSIWAGINGHGKTEVVSNIVLDFVANEGSAVVCPLEFKPEKWLKRLVRQASADPVPSQPQIRSVIQFMAGSTWIYHCTGTAKSSEMVEVFKYAAKRYAVQLFVVDNLAKCGFSEDDYAGQKGFVDALSDFARDYSVHVMLVAHMRKPANGEDKPPEKHDVKGTGALTDMVATVVTVWRNKPKEKKVAAGEQAHLQDPDCVLVCSKQNNGEHEPTIKLWFDRRSHQFLDTPGAVAGPFIGLPGAAASLSAAASYREASRG